MMISEPTHSNFVDRLFAGDGEMAHLMRSHDWSQTPLGPVETWPQSLRTTVSILLSSRYPMFTFWGPKLVKLYNDAYRPVLGATKHPSALGRCAPDIWAEIWDDIGPLVNQVIVQGEATWADNFQLFMYRSGYIEETYFTFSYSPVRDETGGVGGLFCACTETTRQVLGERRLRTLRDLAAQAGEGKTAEAACQIAAKTLAHNSADLPFALLYLLDAEGQEARLVGITGLQPDTPASPTAIALSTQVEPDQTQSWPLATVVQTNQVKRVEDVIERFGSLPAGLWNESPHMALILPIASPGQDRPTGLLVAGISSRRVLDDDYQGFLELVAGQVATAITDARAYEAERQRAEALAELDRAKTTFFGNVSHEFRTPLTLMLAPVEDALEDTATPLPPSQRDRIQIVQRNGRRLLKLVNTLLDFSRIEAGRIEAVYEPTDLATFTVDLASSFRSLIERAGLSLVVECPPLPEAVYVDRDMWEKIVLNLLSNAFKFTLSGTITVRLRGYQDHVELAVEDTGIGISSDEIPHLFDRFHRVKGAQGRSFEGSGIGLSLVQELVKLHGGNIQVSSQPGEGSCLTIAIPTGSAHLSAEHISASRTLVSTAVGATPYIEEAWRWLPEGENGEWGIGNGEELSTLPPAALPPPASPAPAHILVVDDNADMRDYVKRLLEQRYTVETVPDGMAALAAIRQCLPDLVLTDAMMPQLDGFGLLQMLRTNPDTRELPIILLSARAGEEARVEGLEAGADDYLTKPFSSRELMARVEATLKLSQIRHAAALKEQILRLTAEQAQQETEATFARLTQLLETMSDAFVELDRDWRITYQNAAAEQINHGKPRSQVLGKTLWEEWPDAVGSELEAQYRWAIAEQIPVHFEHHYYAPPNFDLWLEIHAYPSEAGLGIFYRDITERQHNEAQRQQAEEALRQAKAELEIRVVERTEELQQANDRLQQELVQRAQIEQQLRQSETRYRAIVEDQTELIARFAPDSTILFINDAYCRYFNLKRDEIIGKSYSPVIYEADREKVAQLVQSLSAENPTLIIENRVIDGWGEVRWTQWVNRLLFDPQGNLIEFQAVGRDITDLKQTEQALRESQERLQLALEASGDGIWDWNISTDEVYLSPQYFYMLGYDVGELPMLSSTWYQLMHPDDLVWVREILAAHLKDNSVCYKFDHRLRTKSGEWKWIADYGKVVAWDEAGNPARMIGTHRDVNDRKLIEAALRRSEEQRRLALDLTRLGFWDLHLPTGELIWNENHFTLLGLPISSVPRYEDWRDRIHPDDLEQAEQRFLNSIETHTDYESEYRVAYPDGSVRWLMARGRAIYDDQNQPLRSLGVILDINDRKRMEASLQESARRWRSLLDNVQLAVIELDINGNIEYANPFFLQLTEYLLEEILNRNWFDTFLVPSQRQSAEAHFRQALNQNSSTHYQNNILAKSGKECIFAWNNTVLRNAAGEAIGKVSIGEDITERYKVERMKSEFISVVSHELRTPLTSMQAALSLLSEKIIDPASVAGEATI
ncbi:MAG TPA: PAS domain S-box protein, partial [Coleofasciculaceae cyanobacterium]